MTRAVLSRGSTHSSKHEHAKKQATMHIMHYNTTIHHVMIHIYIYIYKYMYICVYVYKYTISIYIYVCTYISIYRYMYLHT